MSARPTAAPYRWPYRDHRTMAEVEADRRPNRLTDEQLFEEMLLLDRKAGAR